MLRPGSILRRLAVVAALIACASCASRSPADVAALVPADAAAAVLLPPLESLRPPLLAFADGMEGAQGVFDWLAQRYGVDLQAEDGLPAIGVDPRAGAALFWHEGFVVVALGVRDAEAFQAFVAGQLPLFGYGAAQPLAGAAPLETVWTARDRGPNGVPPVAWAVHEGRAVLALPWGAPTPAGAGADEAGGPAPADPTEPVRVLLTRGPAAALVSDARFTALTGAPAGQAGAAPAGDGPGATIRAWLDVERTLLPPAAVQQLLSPLGFAQGLVRPVVDGWSGAGLTLTVAPQRLSLVARVGRRPDAAPLPLDWVQSAGAAPGYGTLLPSSTGLLLRLRFNAAKLTELPAFLRRMVLAGNPFSTWHPFAGGLDLGGDLLPHLTGDLALAVLGLADAATLASLDAAAQNPVRFVRELDLALLARVRDPEAFAARIAAHVESVRASGAQAEALPFQPGNGAGAEGPPLRAWQLSGGNLRFLGVALLDDVAVLTVGRDALERVLRAARDDAPALAARARTALDQAVVGPSEALVGAHLSFDRIARELECKGFPPYFLKIVTSPDTIAGRVGLAADGVTIELEVAQ